ncbi:transposase [Enterococcus faecalis]|uniref:transposase n=1 Tax=Enterococcus faecalis TaxID=1351 RepID=UPI003D0B02ED
MTAKKAEDRIQKLMNQLDSPILSIPDIGSRLGGTILAEIREIQNFQSPSQLLAFAGLYPSIHQSGQVDNTGHMVKRGSPHLRWALIQVARLSARFSPTIDAYLDK